MAKDKAIFEYKLKDGEEVSYTIKDGNLQLFVRNTKEWEDKVEALTSELYKLYAERPRGRLDSWRWAW